MPQRQERKFTFHHHRRHFCCTICSHRCCRCILVESASRRENLSRRMSAAFGLHQPRNLLFLSLFHFYSPSRDHRLCNSASIASPTKPNPPRGTRFLQQVEGPCGCSPWPFPCPVRGERRRVEPSARKSVASRARATIEVEQLSERRCEMSNKVDEREVESCHG